MFYEPKNNDHGLSKNPFNSLVIPRPIGWISSVSEAGVKNLAPYSFFNAVCYRPPTVMFSGGTGAGDRNNKDSISNILATGEFVCNLATWDTREQMNQSSANLSPEEDEISMTGLTALASNLVDAPRIAEAPVHLECKLIKTTELAGWDAGDDYTVVFGEVVGIHINDDMITDTGIVDVARMLPIGRLGYNHYTRVDSESNFTLIRSK